MEDGTGPAVNTDALKKAKDDAVAANIKILENFYSFIIGIALTHATITLADSLIKKGVHVSSFGPIVLYASLLVTIVPFYQGMNRFLYVTHVVKPIEIPNFKSSPMLLDIYSFLLMACALFTMGKFLDNPMIFFYLWSSLLLIDIIWMTIVWRVQRSQDLLWARNNILWLVVAWVYWGLIHWTPLPSCFGSGLQPIFPYGFVLFEVLRTVRDYRKNWDFYFPPEYKGF